MKLSNFKFLTLGVIVLLFIDACSPAQPSIDTSEFILDSEHKIELVVAEPDVVLPVAMVEDNQNRFWVVEMPGYMRDIDGNDETLPDGRIVILSDDDQDGYYETRKIFLDSLENPRALCLIDQGLLYTDGARLMWTNIEDDRATELVLVDSLYVLGGNIEHQPNGLLYHLDNWIYSAKSNARYRLKNGHWEKEATTFRGQWGISMDKSGRLIYNHNSAPLIGDISPPNQHLDNPFLESKHLTNQYLTDDVSIYPIQATSVNRGYQPEVLDSTGKVINYTSACAPHVYYGSSLGSQFYESAFVCAPEGNLIAVYDINTAELSAERKTKESEFLISKDETFRPVNLHTGLDGSLYVVDMRKGIIQHSAYMSSYLRESILNKGLDKINGKGRIYKIKHKSNDSNKVKLPPIALETIREYFEHPNLQQRMYAQKEIVHNGDELWEDTLIEIVNNSTDPYAKIHAIWTLEGLDLLTPELITGFSGNHASPDVAPHLLIVSKNIKSKEIDYSALYNNAFGLKDKYVDLMLASCIGQDSQNEKLWFEIANRYPGDMQIIEALVGGISGRENYFYSKINRKQYTHLRQQIESTLKNRKDSILHSPQLFTEAFDDDRTNGLKKFRRYCSACHGVDGNGLVNIAPSLKSSKLVQGDEKILAGIILNGYESQAKLFKIPMPAYKADPNMTDQDIFDIISYLKSTFTSSWNTIQVEDIKQLRNKS